MADNPSSPLLGDETNRPTSNHSHNSDESHEDTPLLSRSGDTPRYDGEENHDGARNPSPAATSLRSLQNGGGSIKSTKGGRRWPTITAIALLAVIMIGIILGAFFAPAAVEEYAKQSLVVEPTNLSIHEITSKGVVARVQANFRLDASKVKNPHVRNIGRFGTWIARAVETKESTVKVYIKSLDLLVGTAVIPRIEVDIRNGHTTALNFLTDLKPGYVEGLRQVANDWLEGRLHEITLRGEGDIGLKSGLFSLGSQSISEELRFEGSEIPSIPEYNITRMSVHDVPVSVHGKRGMAADVSVSLYNDYPIGLTIPPLGFDILLSNCDQLNDPYIRFADATTAEINIKPRSVVKIDVGGIVRELPKSLLQNCPNSRSSPLDLFIGHYLSGNDTTVFVRGSNAPDGATPEWITQIISSITVPVQAPGHTFDKLVKDFKLKNTQISLPSPWADEGSDETNPRISGDIWVAAAMPKDMNFDVNVSSISATADVFYKQKKLGILNLQRKQKAVSRRAESQDGEPPILEIEAHIEKAPLIIQNQEVFEDVIAAYYLGNGVKLEVKAVMAIEVSTVLGEFPIKDLHATATVPIKPASGGHGGGHAGLGHLNTRVSNISITSTDITTINIQALVNFTNPTEYTVIIPYFNIHVLNNGSVLAVATVRNATVVPGNNSYMVVEATWDPKAFGGDKAAKIGREFLSQFISGYNTTVTVQTHKDSMPYQPLIGRGLSKFAMTLPTPQIPIPGHEGQEGRKPHMIEETNFYLFSQTAQFTLNSPLHMSTMFIDRINATALYNHTEVLGRINYDLPFKVPPGVSQSPRLPVVVDLGGVGYEEAKKALGGTLKLDARGTVVVRLGLWSETVWYVGRGIGAHIHL